LFNYWVVIADDFPGSIRFMVEEN